MLALVKYCPFAWKFWITTKMNLNSLGKRNNGNLLPRKMNLNWLNIQKIICYKKWILSESDFSGAYDFTPPYDRRLLMMRLLERVISQGPWVKENWFSSEFYCCFNWYFYCKWINIYNNLLQYYNCTSYNKFLLIFQFSSLNAGRKTAEWVLKNLEPYPAYISLLSDVSYLGVLLHWKHF